MLQDCRRRRKSDSGRRAGLIRSVFSVLVGERRGGGECFFRPGRPGKKRGPECGRKGKKKGTGTVFPPERRAKEARVILTAENFRDKII